MKKEQKRIIQGADHRTIVPFPQCPQRIVFRLCQFLFADKKWFSFVPSWHGVDPLQVLNKLSPSGSHTDRSAKKVLLFGSSNCENVACRHFSGNFSLLIERNYHDARKNLTKKIVKTVKKKFLLGKSFYWEKKIDIYVTRSSDRKKPLKTEKCTGRQFEILKVIFESVEKI